MKVYECRFDPVRDIAPVEQFGFIDLKSALENSVVPSQLPDSEADYNGAEDPESVLGKPHDVFEAIDMQRAAEAAAAEVGDNDGKSE